MSSSKYIHSVLGDWEEVFSVRPVTASLWTESYPDFQTNTLYYQTSGGGGESGYFVKDTGKPTHPGSLADTTIKQVFKVRRGWFQPWSVEEIEDSVLEYEPADEMAGKTARCRLIEVYRLYDSKVICQRHSLAGNAVEIVKALRDGYSSTDSHYQHLCIGIILGHFAYLDKYLDLLPKDSWPTYKEVLHHLARKQENDDESSEEESSDEEESEGELCVTSEGHTFLVKDKVAVRAKAVEEDDGTIKYVKDEA